MSGARGPIVPASEEVLLRQVFPGWLKGELGLPCSLAFHPWRDIDAGNLSVDRASKTTPQAAFTRFTAPPPDGFGQGSQEVWGVSVNEALANQLQVWDDPLEATERFPANPSHALIDFNPLPRKQWSKVGKHLLLAALARGRQHP